MVADGTIPPRQSDTAFDPGRMPGVEGNDASVNDVGKNIGAAYAHALTYGSAQADRLRAMVRNAILYSILGVLAILFFAGLLITATVLLLDGVAGAVSSAMNVRPWAGDLVTGGGVVVAIALAGLWLIGRITKAARLQTIASYQRRNGQK